MRSAGHGYWNPRSVTFRVHCSTISTCSHASFQHSQLNWVLFANEDFWCASSMSARKDDNGKKPEAPHLDISSLFLSATHDNIEPFTARLVNCTEHGRSTMIKG